MGESTILISVSTEASQPEPTDCINLSIFLVSGCHSLSMFIIFQYSMHNYQMKLKFHFCFTSKITTFTSHWLILSIFISYVSLGERIHINLKFAEITRKLFSVVACFFVLDSSASTYEFVLVFLFIFCLA